MSSRGGVGTSSAALRGFRGDSIDEGDDDPTVGPPMQSNATISGGGGGGGGGGGQNVNPNSRGGMSVGGSRDGYLSRKTGEDLRLLNEQLSRELAEKEREIEELKEQTHKGQLQQKLQRALLDNNDLRRRLEEIRGVQADSKSHLEDNASLLRELEA
jgi:hypothetical protein